MTSFEILKKLKNLHLLNQKPSWWWPNAGHFEVVVSAILTQNTRWQNVELALKNLQNAQILSTNSDAALLKLARQKSIEVEIQPSGFFRQKSKRLILLAQNIVRDFGTFENFQKNVSRQWLLNQQGIGFETADAILNFACLKAVFVSDSYTLKFLKRLQIPVQNYADCVAFLSDLNDSDLKKLYPPNYSKAQILARYHGKIVEFSKLKLANDEFLKIFAR